MEKRKDFSPKKEEDDESQKKRKFKRTIFDQGKGKVHVRFLHRGPSSQRRSS